MYTKFWSFFVGLFLIAVSLHAQVPSDYVNCFIGSTNFGTTNPGAVCPNGLMSVSPFNVMGSPNNNFDKDSRWWSTPYDYTNSYITGFSHVNLSGVGCPDLGSLLLMATTGSLNVDYHEYGSPYSHEIASPGYYSTKLTKYDVLAEATATTRCGVTRFTFPKGESHVLLNLGEGLTNESGATVCQVNETEIEGSKLLGSFCYNPQAVFPIYFVLRVNKKPKEFGYWKKQRQMSAETNWDEYSGKYKLYTKYNKVLSGDDIGAYFSFDTDEGESVEVSVGVSFVSIANARLNLNAETANNHFDQIKSNATSAWNEHLSRIQVEGGTFEQKTIFYTALYHTLLHPNILQDVNGQYPQMEGGEILTSKGDRYTVFSLWDTYRNVHQLMTLVYPEKQMAMVQSMVEMYKEHGWLPKWELFGRETLTMEGDPSTPVIVDAWMKGLRDFDVELAYEAMYKSATTRSKDNLLRPDNDYYMNRGYVPMESQYDNSVSHALEYYIADHALAKLADSLGKKEDASIFLKRSLAYKNYYSKEYGTFRPIKLDGSFYSPFDPLEGENFQPSPGFHEGNAWNYTFYVPHDVKGLSRLMGGGSQFVNKLQMVFDKGYYDPSNEPDIAYPYLFSYFKGEEWRTQKEVSSILSKYYSNKPDGIPGNDDTGTMSAWAVFSMMGFYPDCPSDAAYTLTTPTFSKITIKLNPKYYSKSSIIIERDALSVGNYIRSISLNGRAFSGFRLSHERLVNGGSMYFHLKDNH